MVFLIIDAHEVALAGMASILKKQYPQANIHLARTYQEVKDIKNIERYDLIVSELSIPDKAGATCKIDTGLRMLQELMDRSSRINIVVHSSYYRALVRLKSAIEVHQAGFTIADKCLSIREILIKIDWSLKGLFCIPSEIRHGLDIKPECLRLLRLTFNHGFTNKAAAKILNISERTIHHYWARAQNALDIYPQEGTNMRLRTYKEARERGLLD